MSSPFASRRIRCLAGETFVLVESRNGRRGGGDSSERCEDQGCQHQRADDKTQMPRRSGAGRPAPCPSAPAHDSCQVALIRTYGSAAHPDPSSTVCSGARFAAVPLAETCRVRIYTCTVSDWKCSLTANPSVAGSWKRKKARNTRGPRWSAASPCALLISPFSAFVRSIERSTYYQRPGHCRMIGARRGGGSGPCA